MVAWSQKPIKARAKWQIGEKRLIHSAPPGLFPCLWQPGGRIMYPLYPLSREPKLYRELRDGGVMGRAQREEEPPDPQGPLMLLQGPSIFRSYLHTCVQNDFNILHTYFPEYLLGWYFFTFLVYFLWHLHADAIWHADYRLEVENEKFMKFLTAPANWKFGKYLESQKSKCENHIKWGPEMCKMTRGIQMWS